MNENLVPPEPIENKPIKLGIKIEKPIDAKIHPIFPLLLMVSFVFIGGTLWLLSLEYFGEPPAAWLRSMLENLVLAF